MPIQDFDFATGKVVDKRGRQALLFASDEKSLELLQQALRERRYPFLGATYETRALFELMRKHKTGVLFLDADMEGLDANDLMDTIRYKFPQFSVVWMTSTGTREAVEGAMKMGAAGFLIKPLKQDAVTKVLNHIK